MTPRRKPPGKQTTRDGLEYEVGSDNIFADLGLPYAEELLLKSDLGRAIFRIIEDRHLTQNQAAHILGVKQQEISRIKQGKFPHYSVERLLAFLRRFGRDIEIHIRNARETEGTVAVLDLSEHPRGNVAPTSLRGDRRKEERIPAHT